MFGKIKSKKYVCALAAAVDDEKNIKEKIFSFLYMKGSSKKYERLN
jgi:hypothetical protein